MEQLNYSPEAFAGIIPELRVPDYAKPYSDSMSQRLESEKSILDDIAANFEVKERNQQQSQATETLFATLSKTFSEKALELDNQIRESNYDETFMKVYNASRKEQEILAAQQQEAENAARKESNQTTKKVTTVAKNNPEDAGALNYAMSQTGYRRIAALNALALAQGEQYPFMLEQWAERTKPRNPQEAKSMVADATREFGRQTGFNKANQTFLAKNVTPLLTQANNKWLSTWTRNYNITNGRDLRSQALAQFTADGNWKSLFNTVTGTTGPDGRIFTAAQAVALVDQVAPTMSEDAWRAFGDSTNEVTKKPWRNDPRWGRWSKLRRDEQLREYNIVRQQQTIAAREIVNGNFNNLRDSDSLRRQMDAAEIPRDIQETVLNSGRAQTQEVIEIQQGRDQITTLGLNGAATGPDGKVLFQAAVNAGVSMPAIREAQRQGLIGPDTSNLTTVQRILESDEYKKNLKKDIIPVLASVDPTIQVTNDGLNISGATNGAQFADESKQWIANRASQLMLVEEGGGMTIGKAITEATNEWVTYMKGLATDDDPKSNYYQNGQFVAKQPDQISSSSGSSQAAGMVASAIQTTTLESVGKEDNNSLFESDLQYRNDGQYSERVKILARKFGIYPWELVDRARRNRGLDVIPQPGQASQMAPPYQVRARLNSTNNPSIQQKLRYQLQTKQTLTGTPEQKAQAVGAFVNNTSLTEYEVNGNQLIIKGIKGEAGSAQLFVDFLAKGNKRDRLGIQTITVDPNNPESVIIVFK